MAWSGCLQLLLVGATWRLWFPTLALFLSGPEPRPSDAAFPVIGLWGLTNGLPSGFDLALAILWALALFGQALTAGYLYCNWRSPAFPPDRCLRALYLSLLIAVVAWAGLVIVNQHRLQAWAYLAMWIQVLYLADPALLRTSARHSEGVMQRWRWLILSVYFYSAISKFDATFLRTLGSQFLTTGWNSLAGANLELETVWPLWMTLMFPVGELIVALGLATGRARRWFVPLAIVLHILLIWLLGPWGMQHQAGVLLWNVFFIGQLGFLFWPERQPDPASAPPESLPARFALYFVLLLPLAQNWGWCDPWMAWELYAPRVSRVQVFLAEPAIEAMPELQRYIERESTAEFGPLWRELRLDQWSLDQQRAPIYPQGRFQLQVALEVMDRVAEPEQVFVRWLGPANRWNGRRDQKILRSRAEIESFVPLN